MINFVNFSQVGAKNKKMIVKFIKDFLILKLDAIMHMISLKNKTYKQEI